MLTNLRDNWSKIKEYIRNEYDITSVSYTTWIEPLEVLNIKDRTAILALTGYRGNNDIAIINYIKKKYLLFLQIAIEEITGLKLEVDIIPEPEDDPNRIFRQEARENNNDLEEVEREANLNPRYTFDSFVVGANNQFAHAASLSVAENPGKEYNPLFIYGGPGLGKTHLMHSIAHFILAKNRKAKIQYVTSEVFVSELINAIQNRNRNMESFKDKYRNVDVLLIDDVQFIVGKESTESEFFHTFNDLRESGKQIVLSSDRPPRDFTSLEERLRSRFESGLSVDITAPDYETRMAILRKKEEIEGYTIDNEILQYIATNIKTNIRELEGALTKMYAYSKLHPGTPLTLEVARDNLKDIINPEQEKKTRPEHIIQVVADHYNLRPEDIRSQKRNREIVLPRQICMYLIRVMNDISLSEVGEVLGKRDHSTILHGYEKILKEMSENKDFDREIEDIKKKLLE